MIELNIKKVVCFLFLILVLAACKSDSEEAPSVVDVSLDIRSGEGHIIRSIDGEMLFDLLDSFR
jgi:hypothetical protein